MRHMLSNDGLTGTSRTAASSMQTAATVCAYLRPARQLAIAGQRGDVKEDIPAHRVPVPIVDDALRRTGDGSGAGT